MRCWFILEHAKHHQLLWIRTDSTGSSPIFIPSTMDEMEMLQRMFVYFDAHVSHATSPPAMKPIASIINSQFPVPHLQCSPSITAEPAHRHPSLITSSCQPPTHSPVSAPGVLLSLEPMQKTYGQTHPSPEEKHGQQKPFCLGPLVDRRAVWHDTRKTPQTDTTDTKVGGVERSVYLMAGET